MLEDEEVFEEVYADTDQKRFFTIHPEQNRIILLDDVNKYRVSGLFSRIFLPKGYPASVSKDYIKYQLYDTLQAFCSTIAVILATQEIMKSVGVGDKEATPLAATIAWVFRDGCGHVGKILFSYTHGTYLDAYSKKWRLYADILNDAALCIEMALPLFGDFTIIALSLSSLLKAIVGIAGGATRVAMTQHHAIRGNMADVASKDAAQETAVNLIASMVALLIITYIGPSYLIFISALMLHLSFNYLAVCAVCLPTLNDTRFLQTINDYMNDNEILSPQQVNRDEPFFLFNPSRNSSDKTITGFTIILGCSLMSVLDYNFVQKPLHVFKIYKYKKYTIVPIIRNRTAYVFIKKGATSEDILQAYFHSVILCIYIDAFNKQPDCKDILPTRIGSLLLKLESDYHSMFSYHHEEFSVYLPAIRFVSSLNLVIDEEWNNFKQNLKYRVQSKKLLETKTLDKWQDYECP